MLTPLEMGLLVGLAVVLVLVALVLHRLRALGRAPVDPRLDELTKRLDRVQETTAQTTQHAITLAERTMQLAQAYKDLEALKERTDQLPKKIEALTGFTQGLPEAQKTLKGVDERLTPIAKTVPETAKALAAVQERLRVLSKIDRELEELHGVFRSTTGRGQIGEDAVRRVLAAFPDDAWAEKHPLPVGTVDFAVRTPNGTVLPIDSKTGGADDMRRYVETTAQAAAVQDSGDEAAIDAARKAVAQAQKVIQERVRKAARDLRKYIAPEARTTPFVLMALPDAVFDAVEPRVRQEASDSGVLVTPYSLVHAMASAVRRMEAHSEIDLLRLSTAIGKVRDATRSIEDTVKNSVERAATYATNAAQSIRRDLGAIEASLVQAEYAAADDNAPRSRSTVQEVLADQVRSL